MRLPGGAGSAVLIPTAKRAVIWRTKHDRRTFTERVDFTTAQGHVSDIVTPLCHFAMREGRLIVQSVHPGHTLAEVAENTGFPVQYYEERETAPPTEEEMTWLRRIDPRDLRSIEFA